MPRSTTKVVFFAYLTVVGCWVLLIVAMAVAVGGFGVPVNPFVPITVAISVIASLAVGAWIGLREHARREQERNQH